jgi:hypothetical protein
MADYDLTAWIETARQRGWGDALNLMLNVIEPLGPFGAQVLWVIQPASGLFGARSGIGALAEALEQPGGIDRLRQQLEGDSPGDT